MTLPRKPGRSAEARSTRDDAPMSNPRITGIEIVDLRFPTSEEAHGSDAVHVDPDYSAAYVILTTDSEHAGHGARG